MSLTEEKTFSDALDRSSMTVSRGLNFFTTDSDLIGDVQQLRRTKHLPGEIIEKYLQEALKGTTHRQLEDGTLFAEIPGFTGVWASDDDLVACIAQLREAIFDWLVLKIEQNDRDIPVIANINLNVL
jgi:predicted RNase H-like HicB family nuclease